MTQPIVDFTFDTEDGIADGAVPLRYSERQKREAAGLIAPIRNSHGEPSGLPLYLDFETIPDESRQALFGLEPLPQLKPEYPLDKMPDISDLSSEVVGVLEELINQNPPESWLVELQRSELAKQKPRKGVLDAIHSAMLRKRTEPDRILDAYKAQRKLMSTTPEMCRIVAMGWAVGGDAPQSLVVGDVGIDEKIILATTWALLKKCGPVVGFNVLGFDLRSLMFRSILLQIQSSRMVNLSPWNNHDVVDLQVILNGKSTPEKGKGLKRFASLYGIEVPAGDFDGSKVEETWKSGAEGRTRIGQYVRSDVTIGRELHQLVSGYFCV